MLKNLIRAHLSTKEISYQPGATPATFEVTVLNQSEQFASFQLDIQAVGTAPNQTSWYQVLPDISTKNPPGDSAQFTVQIVDNPKPGFVGLMNLTVRVFSLDLQQEERQIIRLVLQPGTSFVPLIVNLPIQEFQKVPNEFVEIPIDIENPGYSVAEVTVRCKGIAAEWFPEGTERRLQISSHGWGKTSFLCHVPDVAQAAAQTYPFVIEANRPNEPIASVEGQLVVLPVGKVLVDCPQTQQQIPSRNVWLLNWRANQAVFPIRLINQSNALHQVEVEVTPEARQRPCQIRIDPDRAELPLDQTTQMNVIITAKRPWFGLPKTCTFHAKAKLALPTPLNLENDTLFLRLILHPRFPVWLQGLTILAFLWLLWALSWLNPNNPFYGHRQPVNSVRFNGIGDRAVSGSDDQQIMGWQTSGFENPIINQNTGTIGKSAKSVRVVRYRPVNNDLVAAGLENGEIQLWSVFSQEGKPLQAFVNQPDDRVFDLVFTPDASSLFSGHGSGLVVQWRLAADLAATQPTIQRQKQVGFAVNALGLVGEGESHLAIAGQPKPRHLAIAGRFNQLVLWDLQKNTIRPVSNQPGSKDNYILTLATAAQRPYLLVSGDNQGNIKIWDLQPCLRSKGDCQLVDEWQAAKTIHSVALSSDGCFLASGDADGRMMLWSLTPGGERRPQDLNGKVLLRSEKPINAVDAIRQKDEILVIYGGDNTQVEMQREKLPDSDCR